jgi:hypothetical protein
MSQVRGGFYPAPPEAVAAVAERLRPPDRGECLLLDPCAGEGRALLQFADALKAVPYGIELSEDRGAIVRDSLPEGQSLAPADFLRCSITPRSFSFIWSNPPYDYSSGGEGRVEQQFVERAANLLVDGGVLALVCPEDVARMYATNAFFDERFERVSALPFPAEVRKYNETIILGCKRRNSVPGSGRFDYQWLDNRLQEKLTYKLPAGFRPKVCRKSEPTDAELSLLVARSPLRFHLERPADAADHRPRPPMSPGIGHRAMLLAAGHIDGLISPPNEPPHVIRGTATKDKYVASCDTSEDDNGNVTTRTVISEKPRLVSNGNGYAASRRSGGRRATASQARALRSIAERLDIDLAAEFHKRFGVDEPEDLSIIEASQTIDELKPSTNGTSNGRR